MRREPTNYDRGIAGRRESTNQPSPYDRGIADGRERMLFGRISRPVPAMSAEDKASYLRGFEDGVRGILIMTEK